MVINIVILGFGSYIDVFHQDFENHELSTFPTESRLTFLMVTVFCLAWFLPECNRCWLMRGASGFDFLNPTGLDLFVGVF